MNKVGIIVIAVGIENPVIERFASTLDDSAIKPYTLKIVTSESYMENGLLNKSKALNDGLRQMLDNNDIVACTDIDMLIPPGLVQHTLDNLKRSTNLWAVCRNISEDKILPREWKEWCNLPLRKTGTGSWNAMYKEDWFKSGGWDERLVGWGGEDEVFYARREQMGIKNIMCNQLPLMHVNHLSRQNKDKHKLGNMEALELGLSGPQRNWIC